MSRIRDLLKRKPRRTAFVLSGGGNLGALQVGMLRALFERRIEPNLILGCSVGALNGAAIASDPSLVMVGRLQEMWRGLAAENVMPAGLFPAVQLARKGVAIHDNTNLRRVIETVLPNTQFEDLAVPFQCIATALVEGTETWFETGALIDPIIASSAIPAVYPPVEIDGLKYLDGAIVNDVPVSRAVTLGCDRIFVLHVGAWDRPRPEPKRPIDMATYAYWLARRSRFQRDLASIPANIEVLVLPPGSTPIIKYNDFGHSDEMISSAYQATSAFLDAADADHSEDLAAAVPGVRQEDRPPPAPVVEPSS
ncbi:patatin-like phospholipase family protein [Aquihabitans sp. McL0605]|uniref:patatin-like phospholipase family protein n=1 Tax=Aquihabitans sp. McL0605 TaxID=3415671 RepID=UPI003CE78F53